VPRGVLQQDLLLHEPEVWRTNCALTDLSVISERHVNGN